MVRVIVCRTGRRTAVGHTQAVVAPSMGTLLRAITSPVTWNFQREDNNNDDCGAHRKGGSCGKWVVCVSRLCPVSTHLLGYSLYTHGVLVAETHFVGGATYLNFCDTASPKLWPAFCSERLGRKYRCQTWLILLQQHIKEKVQRFLVEAACAHTRWCDEVSV